MLDFQTIIILLALGSFIGIVAGMFGIGGGGILVPILTTIFISINMPTNTVVHIALGTTMCTIIITSLSSFRSQHKKGAVKWDLFRIMAPGVIIGTFLGTFLASKLESLPLAIIFSIFMFLLSMQMFFSKNIQSARKLFSAKIQLFVAFLIGGFSALLSVGGGGMIVPYLSWQNVDIKKAIGTSSSIGFPLSISGTIGYIINGWEHTSLDNLYLGYVYLPAVFCIALTSYFFAPIGVKMVHKIPSQNVKKIFAILPLFLSIKMIYDVAMG